MKKIPAVIITAALMLVFLCPISVGARSGTSYNYTISVNGEWIRTQDAYVPGAVILRELGFRNIFHYRKRIPIPQSILS